MEWRIASGVLDEIVAAATACAGEEACGLLIGAGRVVTGQVAAANVAADPARSFEVDPAALLTTHRAAREVGQRVVGCWHSHPRGPARPSETDRGRALDAGWLWIIAGGGGIAGWHVAAPHRFLPARLVPATIGSEDRHGTR